MFRSLKAPGIALAACLIALASCGTPELAFADGIGPTGLNLNASLQADVTGSTALGSAKQVINSQWPLYLTGGTAAGQVDTVYTGTVTVAASSSTTVTLQGSVTDAFGNTLTFAHVKAILLTAAAGNTNDCQIGPGASNPFAGPWSGTTPLTAVSPGETLLITKGQGTAAGWAVTSSTDVVKLANSSSGTSVSCTLVIVGTST
jgi:hypothetical protein